MLQFFFKQKKESKYECRVRRVRSVNQKQKNCEQTLNSLNYEHEAEVVRSSLGLGSTSELLLTQYPELDRSTKREALRCTVRIEGLFDCFTASSGSRVCSTASSGSRVEGRGLSSRVSWFHLLSGFSGLGILIRMPGNKPVIGLSWEPKLLTLLLGSKNESFNSQNLGESSALYKPNTELIDGLFVPPNNPKKLNKLLRKQVKDTTGKNWFDMPAPTITPELKKDLQLLKLRGVMDPKRHYKKGDSKSKMLPKYFQVGTVIESASEFFTGRLTKKERKATLADELLFDHSLGKYRKRRVREIEEQNRPGGVEKWKIRGRLSLKRAKQRRH